MTPECIANHTAKRCSGNIVIDGFCGAGGNTIEFAQEFSFVLGIELNPERARIAAHNASVYGVRHKVDIVIGDFMTISRSLRADLVYLSPPWGGPGYKNTEVFDLHQMKPDG